ncbi:hypothetical protein AW878_07290 [Bordetella pseudohinzii]|uniref:Uncharacterized protein n=1 Tax=Bordetella pseudohinzii TaxID=1331258 RepID=A0ABN4RUU7_9BORD|nr:hypothetical protein BBN53_16535 [Bordetella pseudohinzii]KMM24384.1 hypothetical protein L540_06175 [Bordetella pseudohinzii]KXA80407.1 hypothetical protein AW878_07290 [Bordetella pseudohinzii]KXA80797.1 hypothetical protein AW877_06085 [Bordetella pseudohinzii]
MVMAIKLGNAPPAAGTGRLGSRHEAPATPGILPSPPDRPAAHTRLADDFLDALAREKVVVEVRH